MIGRYGGVVEKFIGDAVMAVWGAPAATEGDAERAVRAALDLVAAVAERRVCSVLFCDMVGFTPLSESRDPEAVRELLSRGATAGLVPGDARIDFLMEEKAA